MRLPGARRAVLLQIGCWKSVPEEAAIAAWNPEGSGDPIVGEEGGFETSEVAAAARNAGKGC